MENPENCGNGQGTKFQHKIIIENTNRVQAELIFNNSYITLSVKKIKN